MRPPRDQRLLDFIGSFEPISYTGVVWRTVRSGTDPLMPSRSGGRWDDASFDALYTSMERNGALAEAWYHSTAGQPIPPSKRIDRRICKIGLDLNKVLRLTMDDLEKIGVNPADYGRLAYVERKSEYPSTQQIGEAAFFYEFEALMVPNARWPTSNAVIITENASPSDIILEDDEVVDIVDWHRTARGR